MANEIARAVQGAERQGVQRLNGMTSRLSYKPATIEGDVGSNGLADSLRNFMKTGQTAMMQYKGIQEDKADQRSNEIIRKLTPEQRKAALESGTLLYQDDPDAMKMLKYKTGRNAAYEVDSEIQGLIGQGKFKSRKELEEYRQQRFLDSAKSSAESSGLDPEDEFYKKGFDTDIVSRNAAIYDSHAQELSKEYQAQAVYQTRADIQPMLDDSNLMQDPEIGGYLVGHVNKALLTGELPGDRHAVTALQQIVSEAVQRPGGTNALNSMENQKLNVYGGVTVRELIGGDVYDNMKVKAQSFAYAGNAKAQEALTTNIASALAQPDAAAGYQMIQDLKRLNNVQQPTELMTPQRSALIEAEAALIGRVRTDSAARATELEKAQKADNRMTVLDSAYFQRIQGQNVATDIKSMPVNANTGEFKESDLATFAQKIHQRIASMDVPEEEKDKIKLQYLRADQANGPFRKAFQTLIDDSQNEWTAAMVTGNTDNLKRTEELQRAYAQMPELAQLYPEAAGRFEELNMMANMGIDPKIMIEAEKATKNLSQDEKKNRDEVWRDLKNNSSAEELSRLPQSMEGAARKVYDAWSSRTGDPDAAQKQVTKFLQNNTVNFKEETSFRDGRDLSVGMVGKVDLMIDPNNVDSWQQGRDMVEAARQAIGKANPSVGTGGLNITSRNEAIYIQSLDGTIRVRMDKAAMALEDRKQREARQAQEALQNPENTPEGQIKAAEEKANKRAGQAEMINHIRMGS